MRTLLLIGLLAPLGAAATYKCETAPGKFLYQDHPCAGVAKPMQPGAYPTPKPAYDKEVERVKRDAEFSQRMQERSAAAARADDPVPAPRTAEHEITPSPAPAAAWPPSAAGASLPTKALEQQPASAWSTWAGIATLFVFVWIVLVVVRAVSGSAKKTMACLTCGAVSPSNRVPRGSFAIEVVLWLMILVPGLVYSLWRVSNKRYVCPVCTSDSMVPPESPMGQRIAAGTYHAPKPS